MINLLRRQCWCEMRELVTKASTELSTDIVDRFLRRNGNVSKFKFCVGKAWEWEYPLRPLLIQAQCSAFMVAVFQTISGWGNDCR